MVEKVERMQMDPTSEQRMSIVAGLALEQQPGLGALTIAGFLREVASRYGAAEAIVAYKGPDRLSWSYDELLARSVEVARALVAAGVVRNTPVGILMTNRPEFLSALFGTALAGGVAVALSTFSTASELDHLLKCSQVSVLLFERRVLKTDFDQMVAALEPSILTTPPGGELASERYPFLRRVVALGDRLDGSHTDACAAFESWHDFLARGAVVGEAVVLMRAQSISPGDLGGIFFSSGTTSLPKGILHAQRAFAIQWWRWAWSLGTSERVRIWTGNGLFWSGNVVMAIGIGLSTGGAIILQSSFEENEALQLIERERVSFLQGRPHQWARLQAAEEWTKRDLSSVKYVPRGELIWQHPTVNTRWELPMAFGATETMTVCTGSPAATPREELHGSCGTPFPGNTLKIVDPLTRKVKPIGERGEMCIKGPTLMLGYLGQTPEQCFDAEGFFCTGDSGYIDDQGRFYWEGRLTDMIKTGGANVSPEEVDEAIARLPGVKRSQTVGLPDDLLGEIVVSCIVPLDGVDLSRDEIIAFLKTQIARYKVPRRVYFARDADFSLTGNEKIRVSAAREFAARQADRQSQKL